MATNEMKNGCGSSIEAVLASNQKRRRALSKIQVFDPSGQEVDKRDVKIDQSNAALLTVSLPELKPGPLQSRVARCLS